MSISRIDKAIVEKGRLKSFAAAAALRSQNIRLMCGPEIRTVPILARMATALLLRCYKGKIIIGFAERCTEALKEATRNAVIEEADKFDSVTRIATEGEASHSLGVGTNSSCEVHVDADGWHAGVNTIFKDHAAFITPALGFAVSAGVAKLFNASVMKDSKELQEQWTFSMWDFSIDSNVQGEALPTGFQIPVTGVLGAGAIGSAIGFVFKSLQWGGHIDIIDFDSFEEPNEETTLILSPSDARRTPRKVDHFVRAVSTDSLSIAPHFEHITGSSSLITRQRDIFVCAVDNPETRRELDFVNTKCLVNSAVGGNGDDAGWCLWSRHGSSDPALSAGYPTNEEDLDNRLTVPQEFSNDECSRKNYEGVSLAIPFVALATGSLVAAACAHQVFNRDLDINKLTIDLFRKQKKIYRTYRRKD